MRKTLLPIITLLCLIQLARGQTIPRSGGSHTIPNNLEFNSTVGEPGTVTGSRPDLIMNNGHHQSNLIVLPIVRKSTEKVTEVQLSVFPNPTQDVLHIAADPDQRYTATIRTVKGELVNAFSILGETEINVRELITGSYILTVVSQDKKMVQNFRIDKIK